MSDELSETEADTYWRYYAMVKEGMAKAELAGLRALTMVPEPLLLPTILARIEQLEEDAS